MAVQFNPSTPLLQSNHVAPPPNGNQVTKNGGNQIENRTKEAGQGSLRNLGSSVSSGIRSASSSLGRGLQSAAKKIYSSVSNFFSFKTDASQPKLNYEQFDKTNTELRGEILGAKTSLSFKGLDFADAPGKFLTKGIQEAVEKHDLPKLEKLLIDRHVGKLENGFKENVESFVANLKNFQQASVSEKTEPSASKIDEKAMQKEAFNGLKDIKNALDTPLSILNTDQAVFDNMSEWASDKKRCKGEIFEYANGIKDFQRGSHEESAVALKKLLPFLVENSNSTQITLNINAPESIKIGDGPEAETKKVSLCIRELQEISEQEMTPTSKERANDLLEAILSHACSTDGLWGGVLQEYNTHLKQANA